MQIIDVSQVLSSLNYLTGRDTHPWCDVMAKREKRQRCDKEKKQSCYEEKKQRCDDYKHQDVVRCVVKSCSAKMKRRDEGDMLTYNN